MTGPEHEKQEEIISRGTAQVSVLRGGKEKGGQAPEKGCKRTPPPSVVEEEKRGVGMR